MVLRHGPALGIHDPEVVLSGGVALLGGLAIPTHRGRVVLRHALAVVEHEREIVLSSGLALFGKGT
jgi:hypothetical protein